jgi:TonB family protein
MKTNMVAREVGVSVTGAHPSKSGDERELFTEETNSVLVHENGGVIQLSVAVARGQLLFLANVESKGEVVGQVVRKCRYKPTSWYVEVKFAEFVPRFWGMEFSAAAALLPKDAKDAETAALVISAEASADEPEEPPPAPTVEEVQAFKREVEAVRERELGVTATAEALPTEHAPDPTQWTAAEQALLPKPSLDFSKLQKARRRRARGNFTPGFRGGVLRLALLTTMLAVTATGAAWYKHWIPWKSGAKKASVRGPAIAAKAKTSLPQGSQEAASDHLEFTMNVASDTPVTSPGVRSQASEVPVRHFASNGALEQPAVRRASSSVMREGTRAMVRPPTRTSSEPIVDSTTESGIIVPPKLIKSVRAVASLDDLRDFETGNVVIDAVVGPDGEVHLINVIAGPPSLRDPALKAVKKYQYEPATRNGQPVPAHVNITIRFRFESQGDTTD